MNRNMFFKRMGGLVALVTGLFVTTEAKAKSKLTRLNWTLTEVEKDLMKDSTKRYLSLKKELVCDYSINLNGLHHYLVNDQCNLVLHTQGVPGEVFWGRNSNNKYVGYFSRGGNIWIPIDIKHSDTITEDYEDVLPVLQYKRKNL